MSEDEGSRDYFGEDVAARYDDSHSEMFDASMVAPAVDLLAELAGAGAALEFGIGTGRIALPLIARGVTVSGIDLSSAMVARLRSKPGGTDIPVTIGDFSRARVDGAFAVVYLVFNTIMNLLTQGAQLDCFRNAAAHLQPGGRFVVETVVPELQKLAPGERFVPFLISEARWGIDEYDVATQGLVSHHLEIVGDQVHQTSIPFRYVWPSELDLMARSAGMGLRGRWEDWTKTPFASTSSRHVSVWEKLR